MFSLIFELASIQKVSVLGVIYMKDIFAEIIKQGIENISIKDIMRTPYTVPETKSIDAIIFSTFHRSFKSNSSYT